MDLSYHLVVYIKNFYKAEDPLLGTDGNKGSVWTGLSDKIIKDQLYNTVLFIPIGAGIL